MTSMASSLSDCSAFTFAADVPAKPDAGACDISNHPAKRLRKSRIENSEMSRAANHVRQIDVCSMCCCQSFDVQRNFRL